MATALDTSVRYYCESDMDQPELIDVAEGCLVAYSRKCPGKEEPNDDSAVVIEAENGAIVMAVADGVGGAPFGYKASAIALQCLAETVGEHDCDRDLRSAILDSIERANAEILEMGTGAATTITVVEINHRVARGYQVGDSMALIVGQRGAIKWKSMSHSPVGYAIESGMIDDDEAMYHEGRHFVSNLVGSREMHIEIGPAITLSPRDTILVGSDGLSDNLHLTEVVEIARVGRPLKRVDSLVNLAADRMSRLDEDAPGKPDDLAILLKTQ